LKINDTKISGLQQGVCEIKGDGTDVPWIYVGVVAAQIPLRCSSKAAQQSRLRRFLFVRIPAKASFAGLLINKKSRYRGTLLGCFCGEGGIRTLGTV